jgi:hypothetical protein
MIKIDWSDGELTNNKSQVSLMHFSARTWLLEAEK